MSTNQKKAISMLLALAILLFGLHVPLNASASTDGYWRLVEIRFDENEYFNPPPSDYRVRSIEFEDGPITDLNLGEISVINFVTTQEKNGSPGKYQAFLKWTHPKTNLLPNQKYNLLLVGKQEINNTDLMLGTGITCYHQLLSPPGAYQHPLAAIEKAGLSLVNKERGGTGLANEKTIEFTPRTPDAKKECGYIFRIEIKNSTSFRRYDYIYKWISEPLPQLQEIRVFINGKLLITEVPANIIDNRTLLPLRAILESLGAEVAWEQATQTIRATKGSTILVLKVGSKEAMINNDKKLMDVSPVIINNRTLVPARFLAESFGAEVEWDGPNRAVIIKQ